MNARLRATIAGRDNLPFFLLTPRSRVCYKSLHLNGAIAQLGERLNGIQEVSGSIPLSSTKQIKGLAVNS